VPLPWRTSDGPEARGGAGSQLGGATPFVQLIATEIELASRSVLVRGDAALGREVAQRVRMNAEVVLGAANIESLADAIGRLCGCALQ
jgi:hypothetical protein